LPPVSHWYSAWLISVEISGPVALGFFLIILNERTQLTCRYAARLPMSDRAGFGAIPLKRTKVFLFCFSICLVLWTGNALCITCDECKEIEKNKARVQMDLSHKEKDLERYLQRRDVRLLTETRKQVNDLRKNVMGLQRRDNECKAACKPDILKEAECRRLMEQIVNLESQGPEAQSETGQIDSLYLDLSRCHQDLKKLKEPRK
jgi:hypothetical protein